MAKRMTKSKDKRLMIAYDMPQGLRKKIPGQEYSIEHDEVLAWVMKQPELVNVLVSLLGYWDYIKFDPETRTWGGGERES